MEDDAGHRQRSEEDQKQRNRRNDKDKAPDAMLEGVYDGSTGLVDERALFKSGESVMAVATKAKENTNTKGNVEMEVMESPKTRARRTRGHS